MIMFWKKVKMVAFSYDTGVAILMALIVGFALPGKIRADFCASFYNVGISVLSIIFSVFFAAMAIIMSSSDNEFIEFLEEKQHYTQLMFTFYFTLVMLFASLSYSIVLNIYTDFFVKHNKEGVLGNKTGFVIFVALFSYSLISTGLSVKDTLMFSKFRTKFLAQIKKREAV